MKRSNVILFVLGIALAYSASASAGSQEKALIIPCKAKSKEACAADAKAQLAKTGATASLIDGGLDKKRSLAFKKSGVSAIAEAAGAGNLSGAFDLPKSFRMPSDSFAFPDKPVASDEKAETKEARNCCWACTPGGCVYTCSPSWCTPLVFDLDGKGIRGSGGWTSFDLAAIGAPQKVHDIAAGNGLLVFDPNHDGVSGSNGMEVFGSRSDVEGAGKPGDYADGFEALAAFVRRAEREGTLPSGTYEKGRLGPEELQRLEKRYGLAMKLGGLQGKTVSLEKAGVTEIALSNQPSSFRRDFDGHGDGAASRVGATFRRADGSQGSYQDVYLRIATSTQILRAISTLSQFRVPSVRTVR